MATGDLRGPGKFVGDQRGSGKEKRDARGNRNRPARSTILLLLEEAEKTGN